MEHKHHEVSISEQVEMLKTHVPSDLPKFLCDSSCSFSNQQLIISDSKQRSKSTSKLFGLTFFYIIVMTIEIIGGLKSNSLAVLTDATHLLTDIGSFLISLFTVWASGWNPTPHQSFGFNRIEVLGALLSIQLIWIVSGYLIFEAFQRILNKHSDVNGGLMFAIASFGFVINFIMVMWLGHDHGHDSGHHHGQVDDPGHHHNHTNDPNHHLGHADEEEEGSSLVVSKEKSATMNINVEGAYLHVIADMVQSVGVMIGGLMIWVKPEWLMVDLICTLIFSVLALCMTLPMLRNVFSILMERTPSDIDVVCLKTGLESFEGVLDVHDLHVWAITKGKIVLACHIRVQSGMDSNEILSRVRKLCEDTYGINHVTVQIEY